MIYSIYVITETENRSYTHINTSTEYDRLIDYLEKKQGFVVMKEYISPPDYSFPKMRVAIMSKKYGVSAFPNGQKKKV